MGPGLRGPRGKAPRAVRRWWLLENFYRKGHKAERVFCRSMPGSRGKHGNRMRLIAENLGMARGGRRLLAGCSFALGPGEALAVTGPNGAGKSSLLRAIAGLLPLAAGTVLYEPSGEASLAEQAHYLGHANALKPRLTARENLDFWAALLAAPAGGERHTAAEALAAFGLAHIADLPCAYLSAGQKRRTALARLLVAPRPLWLLDEPAAGLDAASQALLEAAIRAHRASGGLVIAALHAPLDIGPLAALALGGASPAKSPKAVL